MKNHVLAAGLLLALSGCNQDPREQKITPEMLESPARLQEVANRLEPADRDAFGVYVASRAFTAMGAGRSMVGTDGKDPATVGDAIKIVRAREASEAQVRVISAERDAKVKLLRDKRERLNDIAQAAGWAPEPTRQANAVIGEIEATEAEYDARIRQVTG